MHSWGSIVSSIGRNRGDYKASEFIVLRSEHTALKEHSPFFPLGPCQGCHLHIPQIDVRLAAPENRSAASVLTECSVVACCEFSFLLEELAQDTDGDEKASHKGSGSKLAAVLAVVPLPF